MLPFDLGGVMEKQIVTIIRIKNEDGDIITTIGELGYEYNVAVMLAVEYMKYNCIDDMDNPATYNEDKDVIVEYFMAEAYKIPEDIDYKLVADILDEDNPLILYHEDKEYALRQSCYDYNFGGSFNIAEIRKYNSWDEVLQNHKPKKNDNLIKAYSEKCVQCDNLDNDSYGLNCMLLSGCSREPEKEYER